jgi:hypothetical protein
MVNNQTMQVNDLFFKKKKGTDSNRRGRNLLWYIELMLDFDAIFIWMIRLDK